MFAAAEGLYFTWPQNVILKNCRQTTNVHKRENQMPSSFPIFFKCKTVIRCKKELKTSGQRQVSIEGLTFLTRCLSHMVQIEHLLFVSELSCFLCCFMICFSWVHGSHSKLHQTTRQITHSESNKGFNLKSVYIIFWCLFCLDYNCYMHTPNRSKAQPTNKWILCGLGPTPPPSSLELH